MKAAQLGAGGGPPQKSKHRHKPETLTVAVFEKQTSEVQGQCFPK